MKGPRRSKAGPDPYEGRDWGEGQFQLALLAPECPACLLARQTEDAIASWLVKVNVREPETVSAIVAARGLCGRHWGDVLARLGTDLGRAAARLLHATAGALAEDLDRDGPPAVPRCPICASMSRRAAATSRLVLKRLESDTGRAVFERSFGLCQPHLVETLSLRPSPDLARLLLRIHRSQLARLAARLSQAEDDPGQRGYAARLVASKLGGSNGTGWDQPREAHIRPANGPSGPPRPGRAPRSL